MIDDFLEFVKVKRLEKTFRNIKRVLSFLLSHQMNI